jgi:hypothetical protein
MQPILGGARVCGALEDSKAGRVGQALVRFELGVRHGVLAFEADAGATDLIADLRIAPELLSLSGEELLRIQVKATRERERQRGRVMDSCFRRIASGGRAPRAYGDSEFGILAVAALDIGRVQQQ